MNPGELNINQYVKPSDQRTMSQGSVYALVAAEEALTDANWKPVYPEKSLTCRKSLTNFIT
jgi:3-oxoacyl-(acyl-carrier-protein) synthase